MEINKGINYLPNILHKLSNVDAMLKNKVLLVIEEIIENIFQHTKCENVQIILDILESDIKVEISHHSDTDVFDILTYDTSGVVRSHEANGRGVFFIKNYCKNIKEVFENKTKIYIP